MTYMQPENVNTITAKEEIGFHPAEEIRTLRKELAERLAMLAEKYGSVENDAVESAIRNPVSEIIHTVRHTFQEHLEAAAQAVLLLQQKSVQKSTAVSTMPLPIKPDEKEPVKTESFDEETHKPETTNNRLLTVLKGMNSAFVIAGVLGFLWSVLYYLRGDDISQVGIPLAAAGIGLIIVGIGGRLIQDYVNRLNYSAAH